MRIVLVMPAVWDFDSPAYGVSLLRAVLEQRGHTDVAVVDCNRLYAAETRHLRNLSGLTMYEKLDAMGQAANRVLIGERAASANREELDQALLGLSATLTKRILELEPALVGISVNIATWPMAFLVARELKRLSQATVIMGGVHASFLATLAWRQPDAQMRDWLFQHVDAIVAGEGENRLLQVVQTLEAAQPVVALRLPGVMNRHFNGGLFSLHDGVRLEDLPSFISPLDQEPTSAGSPSTIRFEANRGCVNACAYCGESGYWQSYRERSLAGCIEGLQRAQRTCPDSTVEFVGSGLHPARRSVETLLTELPRAVPGLRWVSYSTLIGLDERRLALFRDSGCVQLAVGIESGSQRMLDLMRKPLDLGMALPVVRAALKSQMSLRCSFQAGFPGEEADSIQDTFGLIAELRRLGADINLYEHFPAPFSPVCGGVPARQPPGPFFDAPPGLAIGPSIYMRVSRMLTEGALEEIRDFCESAEIRFHELPRNACG